MNNEKKIVSVYASDLFRRIHLTTSINVTEIKKNLRKEETDHVNFTGRGNYRMSVWDRACMIFLKNLVENKDVDELGISAMIEGLAYNYMLCSALWNSTRTKHIMHEWYETIKEDDLTFIKNWRYSDVYKMEVSQ
tara:strand:+ start:1230 stop:1634 length:405 start_codon:yes stop_codon:yes gene_type:complete